MAEGLSWAERLGALSPDERKAAYAAMTEEQTEELRFAQRAEGGDPGDEPRHAIGWLEASWTRRAASSTTMSGQARAISSSFEIVSPARSSQ